MVIVLPEGGEPPSSWVWLEPTPAPGPLCEGPTPAPGLCVTGCPLLSPRRHTVGTALVPADLSQRPQQLHQAQVGWVPASRMVRAGLCDPVVGRGWADVSLQLLCHHAALEWARLNLSVTAGD